MLRCRGGVLERLLHVDGRPAIVRVAQLAERRLLFGALGREPRDDAEAAIARMRFALGVDDDLRPFYDRYRDDPLIGPSLRRAPWLRSARSRRAEVRGRGAAGGPVDHLIALGHLDDPGIRIRQLRRAIDR